MSGRRSSAVSLATNCRRHRTTCPAYFAGSAPSPGALTPSSTPVGADARSVVFTHASSCTLVHSPECARTLRGVGAAIDPVTVPPGAPKRSACCNGTAVEKPEVSRGAGGGAGGSAVAGLAPLSPAAALAVLEVLTTWPTTDISAADTQPVRRT